MYTADFIKNHEQCNLYIVQYLSGLVLVILCVYCLCNNMVCLLYMCAQETIKNISSSTSVISVQKKVYTLCVYIFMHLGKIHMICSTQISMNVKLELTTALV